MGAQNLLSSCKAPASSEYPMNEKPTTIERDSTPKLIGTDNIARAIGISPRHFFRLRADGVLPPPKDVLVRASGLTVELWSEEEIARAKEIVAAHRIEWRRRVRDLMDRMQLSWDQALEVSKNNEAATVAEIMSGTAK
jgi:hypothetical protein